MNVRIQTYGRSRPQALYTDQHCRQTSIALTVPTEGTTATAALEKGLQDLEDLCDVVSEEFWTARNEFNESQA